MDALELPPDTGAEPLQPLIAVLRSLTERTRVIKPVFKANGIEWKGWHAYRRGLATNLHELGVPDKVIQAILRHEDVSTTQRSYIKTVPQVVTNAMKQLEERIARAAVVQQVSVN